MWHKNGTRRLKTFFSISAGFHLLFLSGAIFLFPDFKIDRLPPLNIEVFLLPVVAQEKPISTSILPLRVKMQARKEEKRPESSLPFQPEMKVTPMSVPSVEDVKLEKREREEKRDKEKENVKKEPVIQAMAISLNPEAVLTRSAMSTPVFEEKVKEDRLDSIPPTPSPSGEQKKEAKYPSLSEGEIIFTHPRYAENPKPPYPREARKRGYQGEVVLKVEVLSNGQVGQVEVKKSSGHEILDRSALAAVQHWKFIPARKGENAIPFWVNIPIKYQLQ